MSTGAPVPSAASSVAGLSSSDAQVIALALAHLASSRPGWHSMLTDVAERLGVKRLYGEFVLLEVDHVALRSDLPIFGSPPIPPAAGAGTGLAQGVAEVEG